MLTSLSGWQAVGELYHAYITGLLLTTVTRRSAADAAELVFRIFRRQQLEKFLHYLTPLGVAQGDDTTWTRAGDAVVGRQSSWRLMGDARALSPAVFDAWNEPRVGALSIHDRRARLRVEQRPGEDGGAIAWRIDRARTP